ncbi:acylphosphatase [Luteimonas sp. 50]|uniref:acylphosphatase n=1 Tax=Cognatiluteimonas sedimenti TaxID=2927791 RepID=A0ABT0A324_9GAMM|nr:acylphosphatase [Lysobacter sedimenti]MCJ0825374.1 acylphosphatase [Lysobacter sedimenti]
MDSAARFLARGRVQGVCFRAGTRDQARRLGLRGHASNLADGSVEVLAAGDPASIEQLAAWLRHGPPHARVDQVTRSPAEPGELGAGFRIA